ncbi:MAG: DUF3426 domain-containing protein [Pseudomonadota bacterium]
MYTECPGCETVFAVSQSDLDSANGRVRCGECATVFDARDRLAEDEDFSRPVAYVAEDGGDDPTHAETGVGWILLPSDAADAAVDDEEAHFVGAGDLAIWRQVGRGSGGNNGSGASNSGDDTAEMRYDDNTPLPDDDDGDDDEPALTETQVFEPAPVKFEIVEAATDGESATGNDDTGPGEPAVAAAEPDADEDWSALLDEIDTIAEVSLDDLDDEEPEPADEHRAAATTGDVAAADETGDAVTPGADEPAAEWPDDEAADIDPDVTATSADPNFFKDVIDSFAPVAAAADDSRDSDDETGAGERDGTETDDGEADDETDDEPVDTSGLFVTESELPDPDDEEPDFDDSGIYVTEGEIPDDTGDTGDAAADEPDTAPDDDVDTDDRLDDSGIIVTETTLPEHDEAAPGDAARASGAAADAGEHDDTLGPFETAIGVAAGAATPAPSRGMLAATAVLIVLGLAQLAHEFRAGLATVPALYPAYRQIYGESLNPSWNVRAFCYERRGARAIDGRMEISAELAHDSDRPQPYPALLVTLSGRYDNGRGNQALFQRILEPADYLGDDRAGLWAAPGTRFQAMAAFEDPGPAVSGYEIAACYRQTDGKLHCNAGC